MDCYFPLFSVIFCFELFGNPSATPLLVRKLMDQPSDQHGNQNWAAENRRRIARRRGKRPATKAAQIWALWPDIKIAIAEGERIGVIRDWLEEDAGIKLSAACLTTYIYRRRREEVRGSRRCLPVCRRLYRSWNLKRANETVAVAVSAIEHSY
jgi:hypothetical protein